MTCLLSAPPAQAWQGEVTLSDLDLYFFVDSSDGDYDWFTIAEVLRADSGTGGIPVNETSQEWSGDDWPASLFEEEEVGSGISAVASIDHDDVDDEFFNTATAMVSGFIPSEEGYAADWGYEFELTLQPDAEVTLMLDGDGVFASLESEAGDSGVAFAEISLFSPDFDPDDLGGTNQPYAEDGLFLRAPSTSAEVSGPLEFSYTFENLEANPLTLLLRLQGTTIIFEDQKIPEPSTALLLTMLGSLAFARRRQP